MNNQNSQNINTVDDTANENSQDEGFENIYKEELMEIFKNPPNKGNIENPDTVSDKTNPLCGDEIHLELKITNGIIEDAKFNGSACSVSVVSSAFLTEEIIGKTVTEAKKIDKDKVLQLLNLNLTTSRVKCATLVLDALKEALEKYENK